MTHHLYSSKHGWRILTVLRSFNVYVILSVFAIASSIPIFLVIITSLKTPSELYQNVLSLPISPQWIHYWKVWHDFGFSIYFRNSLIISTLTTLIVVVCSTVAAYSFAKFNFYGRKILFLILLVGLMIPIPSILVSLYGELKNVNLLDTYLGVILPLSGLGIPFGTFLMTTCFLDIPDELIDAAKIDGCGNFGIFLKIMLPLGSPALKALMVIEFMWSWNEYLLPLAIIHKDQLKPVTLGLDTFIGRYITNYSLIATAATMICVPIMVLYLFLQKSFYRGLVSGALKG